MVFVKLAMKANSKGVHRTLNRAPKGKGWVQCVNAPAGVMCKPELLRQSIEHYRKAYSIFPDIVEPARAFPPRESASRKGRQRGVRPGGGDGPRAPRQLMRMAGIPARHAPAPGSMDACRSRPIQ
jgi:hypothetical protein